MDIIDYDKKRDKINRRRRERYHTEPEYRKKIIEEVSHYNKFLSSNQRENKNKKIRERYHKDPEKYLKVWKDYRDRNKDAVNKRRRDKYANDPGYQVKKTLYRLSYKKPEKQTANEIVTNEIQNAKQLNL
jgi:hypothetical protein